jgi:hypothetical protein
MECYPDSFVPWFRFVECGPEGRPGGGDSGCDAQCGSPKVAYLLHFFDELRRKAPTGK